MTEFTNDTGQPETAFELESAHRVNIIIMQTEHEQHTQLFEGVPDDYGMDGAFIYVEFIYARNLVTVWLSGELQPEHRKPISQQILNYVKYRTRLM